MPTEDLAVWKREVVIHMDMLTVLTTLGSIHLALRHPLNTGPSREVAKKFGRGLMDVLVEGGLLTREEADHAYRVELEEGSGDLLFEFPAPGPARRSAPDDGKEHG